MNPLNKLTSTGASLILLDGDAVLYQAVGFGVKPLWETLQKKKELHLTQNTLLADKAIGKAAAVLILYLGVKHVATPRISQPALALLKAHGIEVSYDTCVPLMLNKKQDGFCPLESRLKGIDSMEDAYEEIGRFLREIGVIDCSL